MNCLATSLRIAALALLVLGTADKAALAHFPWLTTDAEGRALLFFGETPEERNYKLPESLAVAKVFARAGDAKPAEVALETLEEDDYIGRRSTEPVAAEAVLEMTNQYGIYHGMLLTYYSKYVPGLDGAAWAKGGASPDLKLDVAPQATDNGLAIVVNWNKKPLPNADVALTDSAGTAHEATTNDQGEAAFADVAAGPVSAIVNFTNDSAKGELEGKPFTSAGYYATLTFNYKSAEPSDKQAEKKVDHPADDATASAYPSLPQAISSFGGAVSDGWLYVYSGHTGEEHAHSRDNLSQKFLRIKLDGGHQWEELPMQTPLQGLPLVAHGGKLYRVGGLSALNAAKEDEDIHSVAEFACFDPATKEWTSLAPLPEARSSHDAVVIGDKLYVVGGWTLDGDRSGTWLDTAWSFDLANPAGKWEAVAAPNFHRRALAAAQWQGKLVALGGMNEDVDISRTVHALDLATGEWTELAALPGEEMDGFGASAWNLDGKLFASGTQDSLYRLSDDGQAWEAVAELKQPRFFHRLLPGNPSKLLAIAGASFDGHLANIEEMSLEQGETQQQ